jgi:hypothetical protein
MTRTQRDILRKKRVLEHAERIGNIRKACRYYGVSRSAFYLGKKAYETHSRSPGSPGFAYPLKAAIGRGENGQSAKRTVQREPVSPLQNP